MSTVEKQWQAHGYDCALLLMPMGHRCGYVRVPEGHLWHGLDYSDEVPGPPANLDHKRVGEDCGVLGAFVAAADPDKWSRTLEGRVNIHGGLTYSGPRLRNVEPEGWWIGFDCGHLDDTPDYWTTERVAEEVERLAKQVASAERAA